MNTDRSTLSGWIEYMTRNPYYFSGVFGRESTDANIEAVAVETFGRHRTFNFPVLIRHRQTAPIIRGRSHIQDYLQLGRSQFYFLAGHGGMPHWKEGKVWCAYRGRLTRWARARKIGRFA